MACCFLYFITAPYAGCYNVMIRLFLNNGLIADINCPIKGKINLLNMMR